VGEWRADGEKASETGVARRSPAGGQNRVPWRKVFYDAPLITGCSQEGGQLLPRRHPPQALSGSIVEKHLDSLEFLLADLSEGRLLGVKSADQAVGSTPCTPLHVPPTWRVH
jgi:hypothetical protein